MYVHHSTFYLVRFYVLREARQSQASKEGVRWGSPYYHRKEIEQVLWARPQ